MNILTSNENDGFNEPIVCATMPNALRAFLIRLLAKESGYRAPWWFQINYDRSTFGFQLRFKDIAKASPGLAALVGTHELASYRRSSCDYDSKQLGNVEPPGDWELLGESDDDFRGVQLLNAAVNIFDTAGEELVVSVRNDGEFAIDLTTHPADFDGYVEQLLAPTASGALPLADVPSLVAKKLALAG